MALAALATAVTATPARAEGDTCNIVGEDDLRPGETLVDQYRRIEAKRDHWTGQMARNDVEYRRVLENPFEPEYEWTHELRRLNEIQNTQRFYRDNCQEKLDDLGTNSMIDFWMTFTGTSAGVVPMSLSTFMSTYGCPTCGEYGFSDPNTAFLNDYVFALWENDYNTGLNTRIRYAASKNPDLRACMAGLEDGAYHRIEPYEDDALCESTWYWDYESSSIRGYRIKLDDGIIEIDHRISLLYKGNKKLQEIAFRLVEDAGDCVQRFYADYGIRLKLSFHTDPRDTDGFYKDKDILVTLHEKRGGYNTDNWPVFEEDGDPISADSLCVSMAHEIGHQLGLNDLYPKDDCPDAKVGDDPQNLMYHGTYDLKTARLDRAQIREITRELCPTH